MQDALIVEIPFLSRTLICEGVSGLWQSTTQQTICSALSAKANPDGSVDISATFESNGGISITVTQMPAFIVWKP